MENQLVLLKDPNTKPLDWPMGRILEVFPGSDGLVKVVNVKTSTGILKLAITKESGKNIVLRYGEWMFLRTKGQGVAIGNDYGRLIILYGTDEAVWKVDPVYSQLEAHKHKAWTTLHIVTNLYGTLSLTFLVVSFREI
ncbi:hypothetical protein TNCV_5018811 [Trichonephila clavipes]|nr:hypothetical protein TNCV_5018811 [Trichonephila clavipes]